MRESVMLYTINKSTNGAEFFTELELLWKSFVFSYHAIEGECKRESLLTFIDPNGNRYSVWIARLNKEVTHL